MTKHLVIFFISTQIKFYDAISKVKDPKLELLLKIIRHLNSDRKSCIKDRCYLVQT
jgi:hypothetical protein